jgi:hypothetical protein
MFNLYIPEHVKASKSYTVIRNQQYITPITTSQMLLSNTMTLRIILYIKKV